MMGRRWALFAVVLCGFLLPVGGAHGATAWTPRIVPDVGAVRISWSPVAGATNYTIDSGRETALCVTKTLACRVALHDALSIRFRVRATTKSGVTLSAWSYTLTPRLVVVVAGQSNALGMESYVVDPTTKVNYFGTAFKSGADSSSKIVWAPWWTQRAPSSAWQKLTTPQYLLDDTKKTHPIFGPEIGLARRLFAAAQQPVSIVKCAYPYTSLASEWDPRGGLYRSTVSTVMNRMQTDAKGGVVDVLGALYWYQGESDALVPQYSTNYAQNLNGLFNSFARDLPFMNGPLFVVAKPSISAWIDRRATSGSCADCSSLHESDNRTRAAIDSVADQRADVVVVDTVDLERITSQIHLSNVAELALGARWADASLTRLGLTHR